MECLIFIIFLLILQIREECEVFHMTEKQIREIMSRLHANIVRGLGKDTNASAIVKCFITYIQDLPNGKGNYSLNRK